MTLASQSLLVAGAVGFLSGAHTAIWGMYKDAIHEGFTIPRFARSVVVGSVAAVVIQAVLQLPLPGASALVLLFGLAYAAERGIIEVWKTFVRDEDQSKYFIPMQFTLLGTPVRSRAARLAAGAAYVALVGLCLWAIARLDVGGGRPKPGLVLAIGFAVGSIIAVGGAWKDAPKEGFELLKFFRSPLMTAGYALLLSWLADGYLLATVGAIGFERATAETYKTFFFPSRPRGKFTGKPIVRPDMLVRRRHFVPAYIAICAFVVVTGALALQEAATRRTATPSSRDGAHR